jgi:transcriptional regulator CtsR
MIHNDEYLMHLFCAVGEDIDIKSAALYVIELCERRLISDREAAIMTAMLSAIGDDETRANALKKAILAFAR